MRLTTVRLFYIVSLFFLFSCASVPEKESEGEREWQTQKAELERKWKEEKVVADEMQQKETAVNLKLEQEANFKIEEAINSNDFKSLYEVCNENSDYKACDLLKSYCLQYQKGDACLYASKKILSGQVATRKHKTALTLLELGCKYGNKESCYETPKIRAAEQEEFIKNRENYIQEDVRCGESRSDIVALYGKPESNWICNDGEYESLNYGRTWIILKYGKTILIQDHSQYNGPCDPKHLSKSSIKGKWLCD